MNKLIISVVAILLFSLSNTNAQTLVTLNEVPKGDMRIENYDDADEFLTPMGADYVYIRASDNKIIFEKDGLIFKEIDMLKNSYLNELNKISSIDGVFIYFNKYLNKNTVEVFIAGYTTDNESFNIIKDETDTIYFEEINYHWFRFYPTTLSMTHIIGEDRFTKFIKFNTDDLSKTEEEFSSFNVYPNPTNEFINIEGDFDSFRIYDIKGKLVMTKNTSDKTINISSLTKGEYLLNLYTQSNKVSSHKIIIE